MAEPRNRRRSASAKLGCSGSSNSLQSVRMKFYVLFIKNNPNILEQFKKSISHYFHQKNIKKSRKLRQINRNSCLFTSLEICCLFVVERNLLPAISYSNWQQTDLPVFSLLFNIFAIISFQSPGNYYPWNSKKCIKN